LRITDTTGVVGVVVWQGIISDVVAEYGIPFVGGVGQADYLTINAESLFARFGRMQGNNYAMAADTLINQLANATAQTGQTFTYVTKIGTPATSSPLMAATTVSTTWGDWAARVCQTLNARVVEIGSDFQIYSPFLNVTNTINFSDVANNSTNQVYNKINFDSLADNFYTQVTVTPESFGAATVTKSGASTPYRTYQTNTLNASTAQATDFANYLLGNYGEARFAISSVTCSAEAQNSFQLNLIGVTSNIRLCAGTQIGVTFRGTTYQCLIEGVNVSATPAGASYTFFVSGADLNAYLILDNTTFGTLDNNKLGY
jgi:hypothetical protein